MSEEVKSASSFLNTGTWIDPDQKHWNRGFFARALVRYQSTPLLGAYVVSHILLSVCSVLSFCLFIWFCHNPLSEFKFLPRAITHKFFVWSEYPMFSANACSLCSETPCYTLRVPHAAAYLPEGNKILESQNLLVLLILNLPILVTGQCRMNICPWQGSKTREFWIWILLSETDAAWTLYVGVDMDGMDGIGNLPAGLC